jgi:RNA polymerase sigma-70 factor (ECF subfamily)
VDELNDIVNKHITQELIEGDIKAFEVIFNKYYKALFYFASSYVKNKEDATDIVQSIFLNLWERKAALQADTNLSSYLFTVTKNSCLNYLTHLKAKSNYLTKQENNWKQVQLDFYALENFNVDNFAYEELETTLRKTIASMPEESARIFMLNRFQGLKYSEIAEKMDISVKTVEKKMGIALKYLREAFKNCYIFLLMMLNVKIFF